MKILVSNDDGILANGIRALIEALSSCHEVYVIAPDRERSAAGHSLTLQTPLRVEEVDAKYGSKRCWMTTGRLCKTRDKRDFRKRRATGFGNFRD